MGGGIYYQSPTNTTNLSGQDLSQHPNNFTTFTTSTIDPYFIPTENMPTTIFFNNYLSKSPYNNTQSTKFNYSVADEKLETATTTNEIAKEIFADDILLQYKKLVESMNNTQDYAKAVGDLLKLNQKIIKDYENKNIYCKELDIFKNLNDFYDKDLKRIIASDFLDTLEEDIWKMDEPGNRYDLLIEIFNKFIPKLSLEGKKAIMKENVCVTPA